MSKKIYPKQNREGAGAKAFVVKGELTDVDTEVGDTGGKLVTGNSSFNPKHPTCCFPSGVPCSSCPVIGFLAGRRKKH